MRQVSRLNGAKQLASLALACVAILAACSPTASTATTITSFPPPYAHDFSIVLTTEKDRPRDANGIIMVKYPSGNEYNPVTVSQSALAHLDRWLRTRSAEDREEFLKDADWLLQTEEPDGLWLYHFPNGGMPVPWVSAMAEGHGCSVLVRPYVLTGDKAYLDGARRALATFDKEIGKGGVSMVDDGLTYYEEAMPPESPHILNGMVFAMYGALDMAEIVGDNNGRRVWDEGVKTLETAIPRYDSGAWSYYSQKNPPQLASMSYHKLHIQLLTELYQYTDKQVFLDYANQFQRYLASPPPGVP